MAHQITPAGLIVFCGEVRGENGHSEKEVALVFVPPSPVKANAYWCDKRFRTELVTPLYATHKRYGYVVVTSDQGYIGTVEGTLRTVPFRLTTDLPTDSRRGGSSANRIARSRLEKRHNYSQKLLEACIRHLSQVEGFVVAGNGELPAEMRELIVGDSRIRAPCLGLLRVSNVASFEEIIEASLPLIQDKDVVREKAIVAQLEVHIRDTPDLLVFGPSNVGDAVGDCDLRYIVADIDCSGLPSGPNVPEIQYLVYSSFLRGYGGAIGVRFFSKDLFEEPFEDE